MTSGKDHSDAPTASEVREHFDHDGPVVVIDAHRRSTAAWVRERWDGHVYEAEATVWAPHYVAIAASEKAYDKIRKESPDHWLVEARKAVAADGGTEQTRSDRSQRRAGKLSAFPYPGGKTPYVDTIVDRFPTHHTYVEPFGGSASILLNKEPSYSEVFNDLNGDIVHFFRTLRERREELVEWLEAVPFARDVYDEWADDFWTDGYRPEDDVERAGRFYFLRFSNFNGRIGRRNGFKTGGKRNEARSFRSAIANLEYVVGRLQEVTIEAQDYREVLDRYDREDTLFYLDPPYVDATDRYYAEAGDEEFDHGALVDALDELDGYWICSYGELPEGLADVAETVHSFTARYSMRYADRRDEAEEHLAMSFDPDDEPEFVDDSHRQQKLSTATDGGRNCAVDTGTPHSEGSR